MSLLVKMRLLSILSLSLLIGGCRLPEGGVQEGIVQESKEEAGGGHIASPEPEGTPSGITEPIQEEVPPEEVEETLFCDIPKIPDIWLSIGEGNLTTTNPNLAALEDTNVEVRRAEINGSGGNIEDWIPFEDAKTFSWVAGEFAIDLVDLTGQKMRILSAAMSPSPLFLWQEGGNARMNLAPFIDLGFKGIIWWQGESDALKGDKDAVSTYGEDLQYFFDSLRAEMNDPELPVLLVGLQRYCTQASIINGTCIEPAEWGLIRQAQRQVAIDDPFVEIIETETITDGSLYPSSSYEIISGLLAERAHETAYKSCQPRTQP